MRISEAIVRGAARVILAGALALAGVGASHAFDGVPRDELRSPLQAFRDGARALRDGRLTDALSALQYAANSGHAASAWRLGRMYMDGEGVTQNDLKAFETFRNIIQARPDENAASQDARFLASAYVALGNYWLEGIPNTYVRANPQRAFEHFFYAASNFGDPDGQYRLGRLFLEGRGAARDPRQAARWLSLAAAKSHYKAQAVLGNMLFAGEGVGRQAPRGLMFLTLAKEAANEDDAWIATLYEEAMRSASDEERSVALRMVETWLRTQRQ